jgi:hypothetical protein
LSNACSDGCAADLDERGLYTIPDGSPEQAASQTASHCRSSIVDENREPQAKQSPRGLFRYLSCRQDRERKRATIRRGWSKA